MAFRNANTAAQPGRINQQFHTSQAQWNSNQQFRAQQAAKASGGGGGGIDFSSVGSILGGVEHAGGTALGATLKALNTGKGVVESALQEGGHAARTATNALGITSPVYVEPKAEVQAKNYAASVAQDAANSGKPMSPAQVQAAHDGFLAESQKQINARRTENQWVNAGPSFEQFKKNIPTVSYGQMLSRATGHTDGTITGNKLADFGIGLTGDIVLDPLTHVLPGALDTQEAMGSAREALGTATAAGDTEAAAQLGDVITKLGRGKSVAGLTKDDLGLLDLYGNPNIDHVGSGGYQFLKQNVGGQSLRNGIFEHNPLSKLRQGLGDVLDNTVRGKLNGSLAQLKADLRSGVAADAVPAAEGINAIRQGKLIVGATGAALRSEGVAAIKQSGLSNGEMMDAFRALNGNQDIAAQLSARGVDITPIQRWYEKAAGMYEQATGRPLPRLDDYVNRSITDEMQARVAAGNRKGASLYKVVADFAKHRDIAAGSELFGDVVPASANTPDLVVQWANAKANEVFGHDMYNTNLSDLMGRYADGVASQVGLARRDALLSHAGLRTEVPMVDQPLNEAKVATATDKVAQREAARSGAAEQLTAQHEHMAATMVPPSAENSGQVGQTVATQAEAAQQRVADLAQKPSVNADQMNGYVDAAKSYEQAAQWGRQATTETDPTLRSLAAERSQELSLMGQLQEAGVRLDVARDKLSAALIPKQKLADLTQGALRVQFGDIAHDFDPRIARLIDSTMELTKPGEVNAFTKNYDKLLMWVKAWEITSPRFLSHITIGHAWNNALARIEMGSYQDFFRAAHAFAGGDAKWAAFAARNPEVADAYRQVDEMVRGGAHDYSTIEAGVSGEGGFKGASNNPLNNQNKAFYAVRKGGGNIQHMMRTSLGMDVLLRKGGTIDDAVEKIATFHFDYADLSSFESDFVKRVIPFYTWTRRNLPLQLEMIAKKPSLYSHYQTFTRDVTAASHPDPGAKDLAPYFSEAGAFLTPFTDSGSSVYGTANATPLKDLQMNALDPRTWAGMVTPIIKAPLEVLGNEQVYKGLPITDKQVGMPTVLKPFGPLLKSLGVANTDASGNVTVNGKAAYLLEQAIPALAVLQRTPGGAKNKGRALTNLVNYLVGTGAIVNTPAAQHGVQVGRKIAASNVKQAKIAQHFAKQGKTASFQKTIYYKPKAGRALALHGVGASAADQHSIDAAFASLEAANAPKPSPDAKPGNYITHLSPGDESKFQAWVKANHVPFDPSKHADYDMRGYWHAMVSGDPRAKQQFNVAAGAMHFPDTWKTPYHATFSNQSIYAKKSAPHWQGTKLIDKNGKVLVDEAKPRAHNVNAFDGTPNTPAPHDGDTSAPQDNPWDYGSVENKQLKASKTKGRGPAAAPLHVWGQQFLPTPSTKVTWTTKDSAELRSRIAAWKKTGKGGTVTTRVRDGYWEYVYPNGRVIPVPTARKSMT